MGSIKEGGTKGSVSREHDHNELAKRKAALEYMIAVRSACANCPDRVVDPTTGVISAVMPVINGETTILITYSYDPDRKASERTLLAVNGLNFEFKIGQSGVELVRDMVAPDKHVLSSVAFSRSQLQDVSQFLKSPKTNLHLLPFIGEPRTTFEASLIGNKLPLFTA